MCRRAINLLEARAVAGECDLVVKGVNQGNQVAFLFDPSTSKFKPNTSQASSLTGKAVRGLAKQGVITFSAVPPGSGVRIGLDRDFDGDLDGDDQNTQ
jgi:hypothetical protein